MINKVTMSYITTVLVIAMGGVITTTVSHAANNDVPLFCWCIDVGDSVALADFETYCEYDAISLSGFTRARIRPPRIGDIIPKRRVTPSPLTFQCNVYINGILSCHQDNLLESETPIIPKEPHACFGAGL